jgi:hypothetical protein
LDLAVLGAITGDFFFSRVGGGLAAVLATLAGGFAGVLAGTNFLDSGALVFTAGLLGVATGAFLATVFWVASFSAGLVATFFAGGLAAGLAAFLTAAFSAVLPSLFPVLLPTAAAGFFALVFFAGVLLTKVSSQR